MKTNQIILTALIFMLISVSAYADNFGLTKIRINGVLVEIPVKMEEAVDSMPVEISTALEASREQERHALIHTQFDLSSMARPEQDADDVTIDTREIFQELTSSRSRAVRGTQPCMLSSQIH